MNMHLAYETGRRISFLLYYASRVLNNTESESQVCCIEKKKTHFFMLYAWGHVIVIVVELVLKFQKKSFLLQRKRIKTWLLHFRSVARASFCPSKSVT